jgi:hypothetical protein
MGTFLQFILEGALATDKDFEGERIAEAIRKICRLKNYNRVYFTEITTQAIKNSFSHPEKNLNQNYFPRSRIWKNRNFWQFRFFNIGNQIARTCFLPQYF